MPRSNPRPERVPAEVKNLYDVIDSAKPDRLRSLLKDLSATTPANYVYIQGQLMLQPGALKRVWSEIEADEQDDEHDSDERSENGNTSDAVSEFPGAQSESDFSDERPAAPVRRQRYEICMQCDEEYDVLLNDKKSCNWHDGEDEVDWDGDFWADHDERCHGTIDTREMRETYPEGFIWSCCDRPGDAEGCKESRHRPNRAKRVRR